MNVRPITAADRQGYIDLYEAVAGEGKWIGGELPVNDEELVSRVDRSLSQDHLAVFVAEADGRLIGTIGLVNSDGIVTLGMMVDSAFRGMGAGTMLMEEAVRWATAQQAHKVTLEVWPHNAAAIALYHRCGFEIEGRMRRHWPRSNGELWDALLMGLVLDHTSPGSPHPDPH